MVTQEQAKQHLGIDFTDEAVEANVASSLQTAESYLKRAVGADVFDLLPNDPTADYLVKVYLDEVYSNRTTSAKAGNATRTMIQSMEWQLKLELARLREETAASTEGAGSV